MEETLRAIMEGVIQGKHLLVRQWVQTCLEKEVPPKRILDEALIPGMMAMGSRFKRDEVFLPEVMVAARAMHAGLDLLDPLLSRSGVAPRGLLLLGTVRGDLHDVGKNIVSMMFRGAGFRVLDLGVDVSEERFAEAVVAHRPDVLGLSALLTMTLPMMRRTMEVLWAKGLRGEVIVMVGGAPVTERLAHEMGADGYAPDAASAVDRARELMARRGRPAPD
jgi:5-methyltetrahydrofolate--homocysteine methyltransferase